MCGVLFTWWVGRKNNGPIGHGPNANVTGSAINTRIVKLPPVEKKQEQTAATNEKAEGGVSGGQGVVVSDEKMNWTTPEKESKWVSRSTSRLLWEANSHIVLWWVHGRKNLILGCQVLDIELHGLHWSFGVCSLLALEYDDFREQKYLPSGHWTRWNF